MAYVTFLTLGTTTEIHVSPQNSSIMAPKCQIYLSPTTIYLIISCLSNNLPRKYDTTLLACDTFLSKSPRFSMKKPCWHILTTVICTHDCILIFYLYHHVDDMKLEVFHQMNLKLWHMVMHNPTPSLTLPNQNHDLRKLTKPYNTFFNGLSIFCF